MSIQAFGNALGLAGVMAAGWKIKATWDKIAKAAGPIIAEIEARAKDGVLTKADRKAIAMVGIRELEETGKIKLNIITRWLVSIVVDYIAGKLPDFQISQDVTGIVDRAQKKVEADVANKTT